MPYTDAIDVSAYKSIDLQIDIPGNVPKGVYVLTSMTRNPDDASWVEAASVTAGFNANNANNSLQVPAAGKPLFRYIRWKIDNATGANHATVAIQGMARVG